MSENFMWYVVYQIKLSFLSFILKTSKVIPIAESNINVIYQLKSETE